MRLLSLSAMFLALASAFLLYSLNYETRQLEAKVRAEEAVADKLRGDIAVLKAERAHLARPDRIEPLARAQGLRPLAGHQVLKTDQQTGGIVTGSADRR